MKVGGICQSSNLKKAIDKSKKISLEKFIYSIGIRHIGQENAKTIAAFFVSIKKFIKIFEPKGREIMLKNLKELDGIGETQIISINNFFSVNKNVKIIKNLANQLSVEDYLVENRDGKFSNKKLMFTGGFKTISRSEAKSIVESNGGKVLGSISKN